MGTKIEHDEFFGFLRSRYPFPFFYGLDRGFCQHRIATNHLRQLQFSIGRNYGFHLDGSTDLQFPGEFRINCVHLVHYFPLCFRLFLSESMGWAEGGCSQKEHYDGGRNIGSDLHGASLRSLDSAAKVTNVIKRRCVENPASHRRSISGLGKNDCGLVLLVIPRDGFFPCCLFQGLAVFE
jgi:hypothetical protein